VSVGRACLLGYNAQTPTSRLRMKATALTMTQPRTHPYSLHLLTWFWKGNRDCLQHTHFFYMYPTENLISYLKNN